MTVSFTRDGHVNGEPSLTRVSGEEQLVIADPGPFEMAAIEAVKRCAPIKLPPRLYAYWSAVDVQIFSSVLPEEQITAPRSEEHTSELQSLMRISYAVFCLK